MPVGVVFASIHNLLSADPTMSVEHEIEAAPPCFRCADWDYLCENYAVGIVEPIAGDKALARRIGEFGCVANYTGENIGYVKKQMCRDLKCCPEEILVITSEMGPLSEVIKDWRL